MLINLDPLILISFVNFFSEGEVGVIKELKLANENLKWRLEQRNKALQASRLVVDLLQLKLKETEAKLAMATSCNGSSTT